MTNLIGVGLSLTASLLFGMLYYYGSLLKPLTGEDIFAWRMILTVPFVVIFVKLIGEEKLVVDIFKKILNKPSLLIILIISSLLLGIQLWLFLWAPVAGKALEVSLGYFMLPLTLVITGRFLYKDKLSRYQLVATFIASIGVFHEIFRVNGFSLYALIVALGYPLYFVLRKKYKFDNVGGLLFDLLLILPVAIWFLHIGKVDTYFIQNHQQFYFLLPVLGLLSATALITYILSTRYLTLGLFGLLGYVEPLLLLIVALVLGETISKEEAFTYIPIWISVCVLLIEGFITVFKKRFDKK
jgi:chloramphenicol-sensitive protein RarD